MCVLLGSSFQPLTPSFYSLLLLFVLPGVDLAAPKQVKDLDLRGWRFVFKEPVQAAGGCRSLACRRRFTSCRHGRSRQSRARPPLPWPGGAACVALLC